MRICAFRAHGPGPGWWTAGRGGLIVLCALLFGLGACRGPQLGLHFVDRQVLEDLYRWNGGVHWYRQENWKQGDLNWEGVTTHQSGHVQELQLSANGLHGPLPGLDPPQWLDLEVLDLSHNQLTGRLPVSWHYLERLRVLDLSYNRLEGTVPPEWSQLVALEVLDLSGNRLQGPFPQALALLPRLRVLELGSGPWEGCLPAAWRHGAVEVRSPALPFCEDAADRAAMAAVLAATRDREGWRELYCAEGEASALSSCWGDPQTPLSHWRGVATDPMGRVMGLDLNYRYPPLTGPIPSALGQLAALEWLDLSDNQLTGPIPPELGQLAALERLHLSDNQLTGPIPPELGQLAALGGLWLDRNQLTGPIPPELGQLAALEWLDLSDNQLTGPIPPELGQLAALEWLWLAHNQLAGSIPPELGQAASLWHLNLSHNQLTGPIPSALGQAASLRYLNLSHNQLTGCLPREWQNTSDPIVSFGNAQGRDELPFCPA